MTAPASIRVVQWATGNIGTRSLRAVIEHPRLELVGLWVHSPAKVGRDAAELCGLDAPTGVSATSDVEEIATWWCTDHLDVGWDVLPTGWRVRVAGDVPMDVRLAFDVPIERMAEHSPGFTAHRAVNAVPVVHAAPPGIRTTADLPQVIAQLG